MSQKRRILIQLDSDVHPSVFDRVVATDAGADVVFSYGGVELEQVRDLVYGAMFTRGPQDLRSTAVFIGGSDVARGEAMLEIARKAFLGPLRVSLMLDCGGANTTAAAAVVLAARHIALDSSSALVLGATGPVGQRVVRLLARRGARVCATSRSIERARSVAEDVEQGVDGARVEPIAVASADDLPGALEGIGVVVAAGGPGVCLLPAAARTASADLKVAIDLNAVPPLGVEGIEASDAGAEHDGVIAYGAIGVGGFKMKIHKAAVRALFESNDRILDAEAILDIGLALDAAR